MLPEISTLSEAGREIEKIPVPINYDIIRLFSEGLYRSPHKAIEELVTNGYDAGAEQVHILLPEQPDKNPEALGPLWVIDNGHGMDVGGFRQLWRVAESHKTGLYQEDRPPIGQFGIGKLAAYVLAWNLTHISRVGKKYLLTVMNFHDVTGKQNEASNPVKISLREIDEAIAKDHMAVVEQRDPAAWELMFNTSEQESSWTAAGLSEFKDLYRQLSAGRLHWVLRTGLPLHANFKMWLDGKPIKSSKENIKEIRSSSFEEDIPVIGKIIGTSTIYEQELTKGKSTAFGRSNGFFVRVRGRVINLEDELFGVRQLNHAAWSRFALEIDADGLQGHLLSSREGVRDSKYVRELQEFLVKEFNKCRTAYDDWHRRNQDQLDIGALLSDSPSPLVTEPLVRGVRSTVKSGMESFYFSAPKGIEDDDRIDWLSSCEEEISAKPFDRTEFTKGGKNAPALRYDSNTKNLIINVEHPFVDKITTGGRRRDPAKLFASSEVLLEGQLQERGMDHTTIVNFLKDRDHVLRLMAGDAPPTATEVIAASRNSTRGS